MAQVFFSGVSYTYPGFDAPAIQDLDLLVGDGEFLSLLGPSGGGKSTLLRLLIGLAKPTAGEILLGGEIVTQLPPSSRDVATISPNYALYPHMTVEENIGFAMTTGGIATSIVNARVASVIGVLGLDYLRGRHPGRLSRGERQSVVLARAMAKSTGVLALDEPLSALDPDDRRQARQQLSALQRRTQTTIIYVTQDQTEAMTLSDRIAIIDRGRLHQVAKPLELYRDPASLAVAEFFGTPPMNTLTAVRAEDGVRAADLLVPLPSRIRLGPGEPVVVGVRAEEVHLLPRGAALRVTSIENTGTDAYVRGYLGDGVDRQQLVVRCPSRAAPRVGETVFVDVLDDQNVRFFDPATGLRL